MIEEWRTGRGAETRVLNKQFPVMLRGSKYATRLPIGTKENLETLSRRPRAEVLSRLVSPRPDDRRRRRRLRREGDGSVDPPALLAHSGAVEAAPRASTRRCPNHAETLVSIETDKEYPSSSVALLWLKTRRQHAHRRRHAARTFISALYDGMVNARFGEIAQRADAPFAYAGSGRGSFMRTKDVYQLLRRREGERVRERGRGAARRGGARPTIRLHADGARPRTHRTICAARAGVRRARQDQLARRSRGEYVQQLRSSGRPILGIANEQALAQQLRPDDHARGGERARASLVHARRIASSSSRRPAKPECKVPTAQAMLARVRPRDGTRRSRRTWTRRPMRRSSPAARAGQDRRGAARSRDGHSRVEAVQRRARPAQAHRLQGRRGDVRARYSPGGDIARCRPGRRSTRT